MGLAYRGGHGRLGTPARAQLSQPVFFDDAAPPATTASPSESQDARISELERALTEQQGLIEQLNSRLQEVQPAAETADVSNFESRLSQLEEGVQVARSSEFMEALSTVARRNVNGRIHIDQWSFPDSSAGVNTIENGDPGMDPENRLLYRRIRFGVAGDVPPGNMSYRVEIEFSGQDGSQFRDAWIGWDDLTFFNTLRIGNQKRPYGWEHLNSSNFMVFLERPFVVEAFNEDSRRFGIVSYGVSDNEQYNWRYGVYNLPEVQSAGSIIGDRLQPEIAGRLANTWWYDESTNGRGYAHLGISGTVAFPYGDAPNNMNQVNQARFQTRPEGRSSNDWLDTGLLNGADTYEILGLESVFNVGPFQCAGEWMNLWVQGSTVGDDHLWLHGGYMYFSYFLTGEHIPWNRSLGVIGRVEPHEDFICEETCRGRRRPGWGAWQTAVRLSYADFNDDELYGGMGQSLTLGLNWYWNANARLQFNYIFGRIDDRLADLNAGGIAVVSGSYEILARAVHDRLLSRRQVADKRDPMSYIHRWLMATLMA